MIGGDGINDESKKMSPAPFFLFLLYNLYHSYYAIPTEPQRMPDLAERSHNKKTESTKENRKGGYYGN